MINDLNFNRCSMCYVFLLGLFFNLAIVASGQGNHQKIENLKFSKKIAACKKLVKKIAATTTAGVVNATLLLTSTAPGDEWLYNSTTTGFGSNNTNRTTQTYVNIVVDSATNWLGLSMYAVVAVSVSCGVALALIVVCVFNHYCASRR
jgi:hypothetical protein